MAEEEKLCVSCGLDVRHARRFKDGAGRLFCVACAEHLKRATMPSEPSVPGAAKPSAMPIASAAPDDGTIALADEPDPRPRTPVKSPQADLELCPDCGVPVGTGPVCLSCGHDRRSGQAIGGDNVPGPAGEPPMPKAPKPPKPCIQCGYDLRGLKTARCPECGTLNPRLKPGQQSEKQTLREMYRKPLIMIGIGLAIVVLVLFASGALGGATPGAGARVLSGGRAVMIYLVSFPVLLAIGFVAYVLCSMMFIGFDEPLGVTFLRLGAVYAITDAVQAIIHPVPILNWVGWLIGGIVYLGLLMQLMELDLEDAWLVAAISFIIKIAITIGLAALLSGVL